MITVDTAKTSDIPALLDLWRGLMDYHLKLDPYEFKLKDNSRSIIKKFW